ncbi:uncharacterized protein LAESUDRAFT_750873 [Laetiporus sulphureus 93-53]|uniref:SPIN90/Ldb17 leucine-rich domain-containing protein n=1 Tax=Laetiporus sulphureus 93-53 TaxID=1314785 RepID=A0A165DI81_9APHY|nr:uncharacterized protein LAESUDRAFT_750873 [Laetiporus sulphureus 93-53]KZT04939.1 hypothetical protein LAESUDRAFT_750873 [Laetiporus sulphureus 93-53]
MPVPPMDVFGIVYLIENAQQFWSELEDILHIADGLTLDRLDSTLRRFISFCAAYHEQYLQSPWQMEHAFDFLVASELFTFHSERMSEILLEDSQQATDPHQQFIIYSVLLAYGRRNPNFLRAQKRWQPLIPLLMDNVLMDIDPDVEDTFSGSTSGTSSGVPRAISVPIEAKLRSLSVRLLYEVCRVQKMSLQDLGIFSDTFIDYLFELVEQTRHMQDDTFNYSVIKLLVALNEQFMVASLHSGSDDGRSSHSDRHKSEKPEHQNRVLRVLMARSGSSMTFGENMIFMLNRADRTPEDLCMQLLVLKLLFLLFTTKGMSEYFYTNDLCVLVDVFLREIGDIDEDNESLRHTYLRVLHPLLTKTQLRSMPYKRAQIVRTLESLIEHESIRDVDPTTKRLVNRCLSGDCTFNVERKPSLRGKNAMASRSAENLLHPNQSRMRSGSGVHKEKGHSSRAGHPEPQRQSSVDSSASLPRVAVAAMGTTSSAPRRRERTGSMCGDPAAMATFSSLSIHERKHTLTDVTTLQQEPVEMHVASPHIRVECPTTATESPDSPVSATSLSSAASTTKPHRRAAPAPPSKRRKPPAVPVGRKRESGTITALAAASSQPSLTSLLPHRHLPQLVIFSRAFLSSIPQRDQIRLKHTELFALDNPIFRPGYAETSKCHANKWPVTLLIPVADAPASLGCAD